MTAIKERYSVKEYKANKHKLKELAEKLPRMVKEIPFSTTVPGYELINLGIVFLPQLNTWVDPITDYVFKNVRFEEINNLENLKHIFMDKGIKGLEEHVAAIPVYQERMKAKYPELFK